MTRAVQIQRESAEYLWDGGLKLHLSAQLDPALMLTPGITVGWDHPQCLWPGL